MFVENSFLFVRNAHSRLIALKMDYTH